MSKDKKQAHSSESANKVLIINAYQMHTSSTGLGKVLARLVKVLEDTRWDPAS